MERVDRHLLPTSSYVAEFCLVFVACFVGGLIGLSVPFTRGNLSPVWPPAGIAFAALLLIGYRIAPAIALAAFAVNFVTSIPLLPALGLAVGNTAGPLVSAMCLRRQPAFRCSLSRLQDVHKLIMLAVPAGSFISSVIGLSTLFLARMHPWPDFLPAWRVWWLGDAMGMLIVGPVLLSVTTFFFHGRRVTKPNAAELLILLFAAIAVSMLIFGASLHLGTGQDVLTFSVIPVVLWGAIRFQAPGVSAVTSLIAGVAVFETAVGRGPFVRSDPLLNATLLQLFLGVLSVSGLTLAAVVSERSYLIRQQARREAIAESDRRYRAILDSANEGIWILDAQFRTAFVNPRMAELLGYTVEEMIGTSLFDYVFEQDRERKRRELESIRSAVTERISGRYLKKDGTELWVAISRAATFDEDGSFTGVLKMVSDLTHEIRMRHERQEALDRAVLLSQAVEQTADGVLITDRDGSVQYVNPAFEVATGYTREEVVGKTPRILKSGQHDKAFYDQMWSLLLSGSDYRGTLVNRKKTGDLYTAELSITPIKDSQNSITHFVSVIKDVTEARNIEEQRLQLRLARDVQQKFYAEPPHVRGLDIAAAAHPAEQTGGDYFDVIPFRDDYLYVAVGDVSGHGLDSALVMAMTRAYVRSFVSLGLDPAQVLSSVNRALVADLGDNRYVTVLLGRLDIRSCRFVYAGAGHVPGYIVARWGEIQEVLESTGLPLGMFPESVFANRALDMKPGDVLLLCTDGAEETTTCEGLEFGCERIIEYIRHHMAEPANEIAEGLYIETRSFAGMTCPQADDVTLVLIKVSESFAGAETQTRWAIAA